MLFSIPSALAESKDNKGISATQLEKEEKERAARTACLSGDVQAGVALLAELYVRYQMPTYLFNQGRCYQQNGKNAEAITRFREYQRKIRSSGGGSDEDAEGHIRECEDLLNRERSAVPLGAEATAASPNHTPKSSTQQPLGRTPSVTGAPNIPKPTSKPMPTGDRSDKPVGLDLPKQPTAPPSPVYQRTWFWVVASSVIMTAAVGGLWAAGAFKGSDNCPPNRQCSSLQ